MLTVQETNHKATWQLRLILRLLMMETPPT